MFTQQGQLHSFDADYRVSFSLEDLADKEGYELRIGLDVSFDDIPSNLSKLLIRPRQAHTVDPGLIRLDENGECYTELKIIAEKRQSELGIIITPWLPRKDPNEGRLYSTHIKLLSAEKLTLCSEVIEGHQNQQTLEKVSELYDKNALHYSLLGFTTDARRVLDYEPFVKLMSDLSNSNYKYGSQIGRTRADFFKNMITGDSGGKYHKISNYRELQSKLNIYQKQNSLSAIDEEYATQLALRDLDSSQYFEELYTVLDRLQIVERNPHLLREYQLEFFIAKLKLEQKNISMSALNELSETSNIEDYDAAVNEAKTGGESIEETAALWRALIDPALNRSDKKLQFILGRYLHWKTRYYTESDRNLDYAPILYRGAAEFSRAIGDTKYHQLSKYNCHIREGFTLLANNSPSAAQDEFDRALQIASNDSGEWYEKRLDLMIVSIQYKTIAQVSGGSVEYEHENESLSFEVKEVGSEEVRKKLSLIDERIDLLYAVFSETDVSIDYAVNNLRMKRFRLLANQRINTQQYDLAIEAIDESIKICAQAGDQEKQRYLISFRKHVSAVLAETEAKFGEAANHYEDVAESPEYTSSPQHQRYHRIRSKTCQAKAALLANKIDKASRLVDEITESLSEIKYEAADLSILIEILRDFQNSEKSDIGSVFNQISRNRSNDEDFWNLFVSFDYKPAVTAVLSAQRLKTRGVDNDLLELFIRFGIAESFTPDSSDEFVSNMGLSEISFESVWRKNLPVFTHRNLERIEIKENNTMTGDYSDIASKLLSTLEKYLEVIVEYNGDKYFDNWREIIAEDPEKDLALGDLAQFFQRDEFSSAATDFREEVKQNFDRYIVREMQLAKIRNELDHGHIDMLSEDEYNTIKSVIIGMFEATAPKSPVIFQPTSKNEFGSSTIYSCELFGSHPPKQIPIEPGTDLEVNGVYFMSPECRPDLRTGDVLKIESDNIIQCSERRVMEAVEKSK